jgi:hypothetical protein
MRVYNHCRLRCDTVDTGTSWRMLLKNFLHPFLKDADFSVTLLPCTKLHDVTSQKIRLLLLSTDGVLQPTPELISTVLKVTVHHLRKKKGREAFVRIYFSLHLMFLVVVLSRRSVCLLQVSLCDEYSLPVDFVNKRRPHSFGAGLANWTTPSPNGEQVTEIFS